MDPACPDGTGRTDPARPDQPGRTDEKQFNFFFTIYYYLLLSFAMFCYVLLCFDYVLPCFAMFFFMSRPSVSRPRWVLVSPITVC